MNFNHLFISHFGSHIQRKLQTKIFPKPYETIRIITFEFKISAKFIYWQLHYLLQYTKMIMKNYCQQNQFKFTFMTTTSGNVWAYYFDIYVLNYWANKDECNQIWVNTTNGLWLLIVKSLNWVRYITYGHKASLNVHLFSML